MPKLYYIVTYRSYETSKTSMIPRQHNLLCFFENMRNNQYRLNALGDTSLIHVCIWSVSTGKEEARCIKDYGRRTIDQWIEFLEYDRNVVDLSERGCLTDTELFSDHDVI